MLRMESFWAMGIVLMYMPLVVYSQNKSSVLFNVQPGKNNTIVIWWNARPETDSVSYVIEKSKDKKNWETIAHVASQSLSNYSIIDFHPSEGFNYYRVQGLKNNEKLFVTEMKWIQVSNTNKLYIWPNPSNEILHVKSPFAGGSIDLADAEGKFISKTIITDYITDIPTDRLSRGMYILHVRHDKEILAEKFIKE